MKRIVTVAAAVTAVAVAVPTATAQNRAQVKPQLTAQVTTQVVDVQVAKVQRAQTAVSLQRHLVQVAYAKRFSLQRANVR